MKDLMRKCYREKGIADANAKRFENRASVIQRILADKDFFQKEDWTLLTKWAIGVVSDDAVDDQLTKLEEAFCEKDERYTNENTKELHILVELLLFQYCQRTENLLLSLIVICGYGIGWRLKNKLLYDQFFVLTNETRLALRQVDQYMLADVIDIQASLQTIKAQMEVEEMWETVAETTEEESDLTVFLEAAKERICNLERRSRVLSFALSVQREESDVLWWMISEWSETCQKSYRDMSREEAAVFSAYELNKNMSFFLGPYASKELLSKMISLGRSGEQGASSAAVLIDRLDDKMPPSLEKCCVTELQPILSALSAKRNARQRGKDNKWREYYETTCGKDLDSLLLTPFDLGWQMYLEIELGRQLYAENRGE